MERREEAAEEESIEEDTAEMEDAEAEKRKLRMNMQKICQSSIITIIKIHVLHALKISLNKR